MKQGSAGRSKGGLERGIPLIYHSRSVKAFIRLTDRPTKFNILVLPVPQDTLQ